MYAREFPGHDEPLTFGVSGKLIKNALVMYDRQTDTLWSQFLGVAVDGPLAGERLQPVAGRILPWSEWRSAHPETLVLDQGRQRADPYRGYYTSDSTGVIGVEHRDERLDTKEFVLSIELPGARPKAYPYRFLNDEPVVNDRVGGIELVVVFDREAGSAAAFDRTVGGDLLHFEPVGDGSAGAFVDRETGSEWSLITGRAEAGPLAGERLEPVSAIPIFWFAWADFFPDGDVWEPGEDDASGR